MTCIFAGIVAAFGLTILTLAAMLIAVQYKTHGPVDEIEGFSKAFTP